MNDFISNNPDYGLDPEKESKKQKHILMIFIALFVSVLLGIAIFIFGNLGEIITAKEYVKEHYGDNYSYVSAKAFYTGAGGCVISPKESVAVVFQGSDLSVITVTVKNGEVASVN